MLVQNIWKLHFGPSKLYKGQKKTKKSEKVLKKSKASTSAAERDEGEPEHMQILQASPGRARASPEPKNAVHALRECSKKLVTIKILLWFSEENRYRDYAPQRTAVAWSSARAQVGTRGPHIILLTIHILLEAMHNSSNTVLWHNIEQQKMFLTLSTLTLCLIQYVLSLLDVYRMSFLTR